MNHSISASLFFLFIALFCEQTLAQDAKPLCGERSSSRNSILIGSFLVSGTEPGDATNLDRAFSGTIAGTFGAGSIAVYVWDSASPDARRFSSARELIEAAFLQGGFQGDKRNVRLTRDLGEFLKSQNCDFLVGGQIAKDSKILVATPYVFRTSDGSFSQLKPIVQDASSPINAAAERFAAQYRDFIKRQGLEGKPASAAQVSVGCFQVVGNPAEAVRKELEPVVITLHSALQREIATDTSTHFPWEVSHDSTSG